MQCYNCIQRQVSGRDYSNFYSATSDHCVTKPLGQAYPFVSHNPFKPVKIFIQYKPPIAIDKLREHEYYENRCQYFLGHI